MKDLMSKYEEEKTRLNELGQKSLEQGIPLAANDAVQAQSRKVDELVLRFYLQRKVKREQKNR
ncbi:aspartyl-phosphate phosphatase Spo0E family protein [Paenibacillaceae bacterium WGS1546]|uniref:aspartyl-phosphate phosphatase Spo0E family protein n=1 Tax=Cohnella sp. WGS1546 TaxID=3366810 RepID=UPI00372D1579